MGIWDSEVQGNDLETFSKDMLVFREARIVINHKGAGVKDLVGWGGGDLVVLI